MVCARLQELEHGVMIRSGVVRAKARSRPGRPRAETQGMVRLDSGIDSLCLDCLVGCLMSRILIRST